MSGKRDADQDAVRRGGAARPAGRNALPRAIRANGPRGTGVHAAPKQSQGGRAGDRRDQAANGGARHPALLPAATLPSPPAETSGRSTWPSGGSGASHGWAEETFLNSVTVLRNTLQSGDPSSTSSHTTSSAQVGCARHEPQSTMQVIASIAKNAIRGRISRILRCQKGLSGCKFKINGTIAADRVASESGRQVSWISNACQPARIGGSAAARMARWQVETGPEIQPLPV
jgi:hypothetical protein